MQQKEFFRLLSFTIIFTGAVVYPNTKNESQHIQNSEAIALAITKSMNKGV